MKFYLGVHVPGWLFREQFADVPLFISHNQMRRRKSMTGAATRWALDSGGFTQLSKNPEGWPKGCEEPYVEAVTKYMGTGTLDFASQQDWMCEPWLLHGRSVQEHQERTVANYLRLCELAPDLPWLPVLQGWEIGDYHRHIDMFASAGIELTRYNRVGIGSVCRRQASDQIGAIVTSVASRGIRAHGFGVKLRGLEKYGQHLASADSMAWSFGARRQPPLPGCHHGRDGTGNCANCPIFALAWREKVLAALNVTINGEAA